MAGDIDVVDEFRRLSDSVEILFQESAGWLVLSLRLTGTRYGGRRPCEDAVGAELTAHGDCYVAVADGVGSGARGDVCSAAAVAHAVRLRTTGEPGAAATLGDVRSAMASADDSVKVALSHVTPNRGATMLAAVWLHSDGSGYFSHVGDCRIYQASYQNLSTETVAVTQLTQDHSYRNLGLAPPPQGSADDPARMLGIHAAGTPQVSSIQLGAAGLLLLCSDGIHGYVPDDTLGSRLDRGFADSFGRCGKLRADSLKRMCLLLVRDALERGGADDIAIAVVARPHEGHRTPEDGPEEVDGNPT